MQGKFSRRSMVKGGLIAGSLAPIMAVLARTALAAAPLTPLDPNDPTAKALGFVLDSSKVDPKANPTHAPAQKCGTCAQFQGKPADASAACAIFTGHTVPQGGWCKVWAQKPGA